jgi:hypothetical protein
MTQAYVIEIGEIAAGLAYREKNGFRFIASARGFAALDGMRYASPAQAERAVRAFFRQRDTPPA